ncbi:MAG TPA: PfkB family carbohydrate kinase [Streptosporangiaceae bacterium]|nr:PfkB family carbohydrate kinase [Streptosporangiaceae bacterium]
MTGGPLVIVGDALLDVDIRGTLSRVTSGGAGGTGGSVPVVDCGERRERPGGAGLAALLAAAPGDRDVVLVTGLGDDEAGIAVAAMLEGAVDLIRLPLAGGTPQKTRVMAGPRALLRLDAGTGRVPPGAAVPWRAQAALRGAAGILVADYGRGMAAHPDVAGLLAALAGKLPVTWDPHPRGGFPLPGIRLAMPNEAEAIAFCARGAGARGGVCGGAARRAGYLMRAWGVSGVAVTLGARGAVLATPSKPPVVAPAPRVAAADTCGAGDSFAAAVTRGLADGLPLAEVVASGVHAAASFVGAGAASSIGMRKGAQECPVAHLARC